MSHGTTDLTSSTSMARLLHAASNQASLDLWETLRTEDTDSVSSEFLKGVLKRSGIRIEDDPRFAHFFESIGGVDAPDERLSPGKFAEAGTNCIGLIRKAATNGLIVPNFGAIEQAIKEVYETVLPNRSGENAGYIPQLKNADPEKFGISVCTTDGQQFSIGDTEDQFCIQSCSKPLSYLLALNEFGKEYVHKSVGMEPSGRAFNEICLKDISTPGSGKKHAIPHNPMINAGAMMTCSMVHPSLSYQERLDKVIDYWRALSGGVDDCVGFCKDTYKSESGCADQNWCLAYMMKESNAFPECFFEKGDYKKALEETLELYFSICSILNTCRGMSVMGATLANGGLNPLTGERLATTEHVRHVLPLMLSSGMYDYSGQWSFDVGVPAKSGVGGCVFLVIPNVCGISIFSPRLDKNGNSVRGVQVATELVKKIKMHNFEVFSGLARSKIDLRQPKYADEIKELSSIMFAASQGDVSALNVYHNCGSDLTKADYDGRTALHLAATEGHLRVVKFLCKHCPMEYLNAKDRWGTTALSDAKHYGFFECVKFLQDVGCEDDEKTIHPEYLHFDGENTHHVTISSEAPRFLHAAAAGDLDEVVKLHSSGLDVAIGDYDTRTALHLAACEGHLHILKYLVVNFDGDASNFVKAHDRWGHSALADAVQNGHEDCARYLGGIAKHLFRGVSM